MGIGNDIRPKKAHTFHHEESHYFSAQNNDPSGEKIEPKEELVPIKHEEPIPFEEAEKLQDDFFAIPTHHTSHDASTDHSEAAIQKSRTGFYIWIILIAIAVIVGYQNKDSILSVFNKKPEKVKTTQVETNESYTSETPSETTTNTTDNNADSSTSQTTTNSTPATTTPTTTAPATTTPAASTTPKEILKIEVLNGNGITGSADKIKATLEGAGYTVAKVANARNFNYSTTYIYYKSGKKADADAIKATLSSQTSTVEESNTVVGSYDIVVVVGKK